MDRNNLWSLRLGFTTAQAKAIGKKGISDFVEDSLNANHKLPRPAFIDEIPTSIEGMRKQRQINKKLSEAEQKELRRKGRERFMEMKTSWIEHMQESEFPLREKMTCFWQNHFVVTQKKIKINYWIYQYHELLHKNAFGNFRDLTKAVMRSNAMIKYLDNDDNKANKLNENLSRELLELFTLGIGNYSETDIKNGAKGLAGLSIGTKHGQYRPHRMVNESFEYLGKTGNFKVDEMIDIIFEHPAIPFLLTKKILQWFIYDQPTNELVQYYGKYFKSVDFEITPLLKKIFSEEFDKPTAGSKIKDPLVYGLQLLQTFPTNQITSRQIVSFLSKQGMDLFNQPNVKGWSGGQSWLTSQIFLQRNNVVDLLCKGRPIQKLMDGGGMYPRKGEQVIPVKVSWDKNQKPKEIVNAFTDKLLFQVDDALKEDLGNILKYDFNPKSENAEDVIVRLLNFICKTPEFQLI